MGNTNIELFTSDQKLYYQHKTFIASGDVDSVQLIVEFDDSWSSLVARTAFFRYTSVGGRIVEVEQYMGEGNKCKIPHEVLENPGKLEIGVTGTSTDGTRQKTTELIKYRLYPGAKRPGIVLSPSMDLFQQMIEAVKKMSDPVTKAAMQYVAEQCEVEFERLQNEVDEMKATVNGVVLWENPDTTADFKAQTIVLDLSQYNRFTVLFRNTTYDGGTVDTFAEQHFTEKNIRLCGFSGCNSDFWFRDVKFTDNEVKFYSAEVYNNVNSDRFMIPVKIKGYK